MLRKAWPIVRNALFATSLALNGYVLYAVHETRRVRQSEAFTQALGAIEAAGRIYDRIQADAALRADLATLGQSAQYLTEHQQEITKELTDAYAPLRPFMPASGRPHQPQRYTP